MGSYMKRMQRALACIFAIVLLGIAQGAAMPSFDGASGWLGSPSLSPQALRGKVVLVDFWEYTCLNCLRTLPYLREWYHRYHDEGFEIVGVQVPEFNFSGESTNVRAAMKKLGITWPVALDDRRAIWNRYGVSAWPTEMLFDQSGHLVATHIGEGDYPQTEALIQRLLLGENPHLALPPPMALLPQDNYVKPGAVCYPDTAEILLENTRIANQPSGGDDPTQNVNYTDSGSHRDGNVYLEGYWDVLKQAVEYEGGNGYFDVPYHAIEVSVVMTSDGERNRVDVTQDGKPIPREDAGKDLRFDPNGSSYIMVDASRAYDVIANATFGSHDLQLSPHEPGLRIYDVAFESCEVPK